MLHLCLRPEQLSSRLEEISGHSAPMAHSTTPPHERNSLDEVATILATGLMRLRAEKSSRKSVGIGESSLHFTPDQSGDAPPCSTEMFP